MIEHLTKTGFTKHDVFTAATRQWDIPRVMRKCFQSYFILHWNGHFVRAAIRNGTINKDNTLYNVVFIRGMTPSKLLTGVQVRLSFRKPIREYEMPGFVLLAPLKQDEESQ